MVAILGVGLAVGRWDGLIHKQRKRRAPDSSGPASAVSYGCLRAFRCLSQGFSHEVAGLGVLGPLRP